MDNIRYLYHLTTPEGLTGILNEQKIKAKLFGEVFFAANVEDCIYLSPMGGGERAAKHFYDKIYKNPSLKKLFKWIYIQKEAPVLEIPLEWVGKIHKQKNLGGRYEYTHKGDVSLKEIPNTIYVKLPSYNMIDPKHFQRKY